MEELITISLFLLFACFGVWLIIDQIRIILFRGKIKRGVKIFSVPLTNEMLLFFQNLKKDIIEYTIFNYKRTFIKKYDRNEILIRGRFFSGSPIVGFLNLSLENPCIEIRKSLPGIILSSILFLTIIGAPFIAMFQWINITIQKYSIFKFIQDYVDKT